MTNYNKYVKRLRKLTSTDFARLATVILDQLISVSDVKFGRAPFGQCLTKPLVACSFPGQCGTWKGSFARQIGWISVYAYCRWNRLYINMIYATYRHVSYRRKKLANYCYTWFRYTWFSVASSWLDRNSWATPSSIHWCRAVASSSPRSNSSSTSTAASRICTPLTPRPVDYKDRHCIWKDVRF